MDFKEIIQTSETAARAEFIYAGTPESGMLAWLDARELKSWWKADSAIVEPFQGGMFYLTWYEKEGGQQHAIYGIMEKVDTENNIMEVSKIMYISPKVKMGHLHLHIQFQPMEHNKTRMVLVHTHNYTGQMLSLYNSAVYEAWPKTFGLLKKYLEAQNRSFD
jgi:uncharacterized protein YndB with AHSA1/START domain